jgi:putative salt-induced outer membrane protein YdiY
MMFPSNPTSSYARLPIENARLTVRILAMMLLLLLSPCATEAAVVVLKNGDRITGRVIKMQDKRLEIDTPTAGIIKIKWEEIVSLTTERPMSIKLYGEADIPEDAGEWRLDRIIAHTVGGEGAIPLRDVRAINFAENDYRGYLSAGGNQTSGNTKTQALNISGDLTYRRLEHRYYLNGKYNRAEADGEDTANNAAINIQYDYFLARRVYVGGINLSETDQFQDLSLRNTSSLVLGYDLLDREHHNLTIAAGPAAVYQDFSTDPSTITPSSTVMWRYKFMFRGDDVVFFHRFQSFKDLGHGAATRVNADQGFKVKVMDNWWINMEYDIRYNSEPVTGKETVDTNIIFGFSYDLKP